MLVERLVAARCSDPFSHLGLQANPDGPGLKLTAWLPDALEVRVKDLKSGKVVATLAPTDESGLFETVFTRRKTPSPISCSPATKMPPPRSSIPISFRMPPGQAWPN